jgi:signal peptidase I
MPPENMTEKKSFLQDIKEILLFAVTILVILVPVRLFIAQPFVVVGGSMDPTFSTGQYLIIDELSYHFEKPKRGQVIIFKYPQDTTKYFIKRIIGLPGETVSITDGVVTIKNTANPKGFALNESYLKFPGDTTMPPEVVPANNYFVMGDNRVVSYDSRKWGFLPSNLITGRAFLRLFPFSVISVLPGNETQ